MQKMPHRERVIRPDKKCRAGLSGQALKLIAVLSMTVDHAGAVFFPQALWMRCVGRLAFVLYAFMAAEGYVHTRNLWRYLTRLFVCAILSEVPFDLLFCGRVWYSGAQNVFFTLFLGLAGIAGMDWMSRRLKEDLWILSLLPVAAACGAATWICSDYRFYGILMIAVFYVCRGQAKARALCISAIQLAINYIQIWGIAALIPISLYNGKRGWDGVLLKWMFYGFYPVHMLVIFGLSRII